MRFAPIAPLIACLVGVGALTSAAAQPPDAPVRLGGNMRPPVKIKHVAPQMTPAARQIAGKGRGELVQLEITIDPNGFVSDARVLRPVPLLDELGAAAARQWQYAPTLVDGRAVSVVMVVSMLFGADGRVTSTPGPAAGGSGSTTTSVAEGNIVSGRTFMLGSSAGLGHYELTAALLARLPKWDPALVPEPPLAVGQAIGVAQEWIRTQVPDSELRLLTASLVSQGDSWVYQVRFVPGPAGRGSSFNQPPIVVVLMDGSVLEPARVDKRPQ